MTAMYRAASIVHHKVVWCQFTCSRHKWAVYVDEDIYAHLYIGYGIYYQPKCDLKGNAWVTDWRNSKILKLSQDGRLLQTIEHVKSKSDNFNCPDGVSVSPEGLVYICDSGNHRVTVHDEEGMFLFAFGSKGS